MLTNQMRADGLSGENKMTASEVAAYLQVHKITIYRLMSQGLLSERWVVW